MKLNKRIQQNVAWLAMVGMFSLAGCSVGRSPHPRVGYTPNCCFGDPNKLGRHSYASFVGEGNGILYTLRGGSIDLDHLRTAADLTKYAYDLCYTALMKHASKVTVSPALELTWNNIVIEYPDGWSAMPKDQKQAAAREAALELGRYIGFHSTVWHEMLTWKGTHFALLEPEFNSAFSWEDMYSNALGVHLAGRAIENPHPNYDAAMTELLEKELAALEVVSKDKAVEITRSVRGTWYKGDLIPDTLRRNFDMGYDDGTIDPSIIPGFTGKTPLAVPAPTLDACERYGLTIDYTVTSAYLETAFLKRDAQTGGKNVRPREDFPGLIATYIKEAIEKYGYQVDD